MRLFLITSPAFSGEIEVLYNETGRLDKVDFLNTDMSPSKVAASLIQIPALVDSLSDAFTGTKATVIEGSYNVTFDMFWNKYNLKRNRERSEKLWNKLSKVDQVKAYHGYTAYEKHLRLNDWKTKADPDTYLRQRYWENDWK